MKERRRTARVDDVLTFKIAYEGYDIICDTINVSAAGLLCRINRKIPPMTKIALILILPGSAQDPGPKHQEIRAEGVVVRSDPDKAEGLFQVAIFFTDIPAPHREFLERYVGSRLVEREFT